VNYNYIPDYDYDLKDFLARNPSAGIREIRRSHPALRSMSVDHLCVRMAQLERRLTFFSLK
jgi:hypothetical protein